MSRPSPARFALDPLARHFPLGLLLLAGLPAAQADETGMTEARPLLEITVTASPLGRTADELVQPITVLAGEALDSKRRGTIGATLEQEAGIASTDFGAGAGRPVIRGQAGPRVDVLENGISAMDVSNLSPDHAVAINPLTASQIEVLKGPATLLYGSSAVGGVVNVLNRRLPTEVTPGFSGTLEATAGSVGRERGIAADLNQGSGNHQLHADFTRTDSSDYRIPGNADRDGVSGSRGKLANSATAVDSGAVSYSFINSTGDAYGISVARHEAVYGLPNEEAAFIDMRQTRVDAQAILRDPTASLESLRFRIGSSHYEHTEFEEPGVAGTVFGNDEYQARVEAVHQAVAGFRGVLGAQAGFRDFSASGEEAYVPNVSSRQAGLFLVEEKAVSFGKIEGGLRVEQVSYRPEGGQRERRFTPFSASAGAIVDVGSNSHLKLSATHAQRAPAAEELYANGAHVATGTFEVGNSSSRKESLSNIELGFDHHQGRLGIEAAIFQQRARNYIHLQEQDADNNGEADVVSVDGEDFLLVHYAQTDARFHGYEAAATWALINDGPFQLGTRVFTDRVSGRLDGAGNVPRLTPARYGVSLHGHYRRLAGNLSYIRAEAQDRIASLETRTDGYHLLNADLDWKLPPARGLPATSLFLRATNLLDDEVRRSTSFIKDVAPAPGRGAVIGFRMTF